MIRDTDRAVTQGGKTKLMGKKNLQWLHRALKYANVDLTNDVYQLIFKFHIDHL